MTAFVSYARFGEDFLLWRMLRDVDVGTYFDVGACEPEFHSITKAFYERGWSGVNVEPVAKHCDELRRCRPRDVNLQIAIGAGEGEREFFAIEDTGLSTLDATIAKRHQSAGFRVRPARVAVRPLRDVWDEFVQGEVHFLKVDVEGAEAEVLAGAALERQRPWIIAVESTAPLTQIPTHAQWEPMLTAAAYRFIHADQVNRFYVAEEHVALAARLRAAEDSPRVVRAAELVALREDLPAAARFEPANIAFLGLDQAVPSLEQPTSQLCTESQLREPVYAAWCRVLAEPPAWHRKLWERAYVLQALALHGALAPGRRGLGFGCGREPLPAVMASRGCEVVATGLEAGDVGGKDETGRHERKLSALNEHGLCDPDLFRQRVSFRFEDMNRISRDLEGYDFVWSVCALEYLGSLRRGAEFVVNALRCLKPGGVAVHVTEFNLSSNYTTVEEPGFAIFRRCDVEALAAELARAGHWVAPLNFNPGTGPLDRYVDLPPYRPEPHLRLRQGGYVATSLGLIVRRLH